MINYNKQLQETFGYDSFRPGQEELIRAVMNGQDVMGIMPTGGGKSICFQLPSLLLGGLTLVISPLISLMLDQVLALKEYGVRAAFLNSTLTPGQQRTVLSRAMNGAYQIMYVAPERLAAPGFQAFCRNYPIPFIAVDEAHCISQWGHNFRPDYLKIRPFIDMLPKRPVIGAYTATATDRVRQDIRDSLKLEHPVTVINSFDRPNLFFEVRRDGDKLDSLVRFLRGQKGKSGIIYCATRKGVEEVCEELLKRGFSATRYHAGLDDAERAQNQKDFLYDVCPIITATNAFGMGIDKSNVNFVVHYNMPKNIESYYQEAGRAGRDGSPARCLLFYRAQDFHLNEFLIEKSVEEDEHMTAEQKEAYRENELALLRRMDALATTTGCLRAAILRYFGEERQGDCGNCGNCLATYDQVDITDELRVVISCVSEAEDLCGGLGRMTIRNILAGSGAAELKRRNLNKMAGYGQLMSLDSARILQIIDWALDRQWLRQWTRQGSSQYPVLKVGTIPEDFLNSEQTIYAKLPEIVRPKAERGRKRAAVPSEGETLFEKLRVLRAQIAVEKHVPAYVIFTDAALTEMILKKPRTQQEFAACRGIGNTKAALYAERFLEIIRRDAL